MQEQNEKREGVRSPDPAPKLAPPRIPTQGRSMVIKLRSVMKQTSLSRTSIYRRIKEGQFPKQIKLGIRAVGWDEGEVDAWVKNQMAQRFVA
jgi:prophage regulatory protein